MKCLDVKSFLIRHNFPNLTDENWKYCQSEVSGKWSVPLYPNSFFRSHTLRHYSSQLAMPLWRIFSHPDTFSTAQKKALVESITPFYTRSGLPAFYVNVVFIPVEPSSFYIGSQPVRDMVRIAIEHIAIHRPKLDGVGNNARARMCVEIDEVVIFCPCQLSCGSKRRVVTEFFSPYSCWRHI